MHRRGGARIAGQAVLESSERVLREADVDTGPILSDLATLPKAD
ncbi:hypothetical protein [uncultured Marivita sp.]|nr:hypothetical protein [uncultured Marivita sp.]